MAESKAGRTVDFQEPISLPQMVLFKNILNAIFIDMVIFNTVMKKTLKKAES